MPRAMRSFSSFRLKLWIDLYLPRHRPWRGKRPRHSRLAYFRPPRTRRDSPLLEHARPPAYRALLGHAAPVPRNPARARNLRARSQARTQRYWYRHLGRRFRPAWTRRRAGRHSAPLPRFPYTRHPRKGIRRRTARRDLPANRDAVHGAQHAIPALRHEARRLARAGSRFHAAVHARFIQLLAYGPDEIGADHRQHFAILQSRLETLGHGSVRPLRPAFVYPARDGSARHAARNAASGD